MRDCLKRGIIAGYPVVDLRVTLYDGSYHDVDSSDMAFQIAASIGPQKAVMEARPCLLEPVMNVEVTAPSDHRGRRHRRPQRPPRARSWAWSRAARSSVVRAQVPMAEMLNYESHLRSMTGGRGGYSMEFSHYEELPRVLAEKVVAEAKKEREARAAEKH